MQQECLTLLNMEFFALSNLLEICYCFGIDMHVLISFPILQHLHYHHDQPYDIFFLTFDLNCFLSFLNLSCHFLNLAIFVPISTLFPNGIVLLYMHRVKK